ncbi:hypothetical protein IAU59_005113 [Kwoniella sp. CBS 9459]
MSGLEDLFNSPPRAPPPRSPTPPSPISPARRNFGVGAGSSSRVGANPLFLSPGGAFDGSHFGSPSNGRNRATSRSRSRSISPSVGASRHQARSVHVGSGSRRAAPAPAPRAGGGGNVERSFATHELGTSAQAQAQAQEYGDFEDPFAGLNDPMSFGGVNGAADDDDDDGEGGKKRKRVMAKVDADRLTSDRGFPALCRAAKKFKVRGKGNEAKDLRTLLNMYQMWAHGMFPKGDFAHTVNRVEVVCRSRRMEMAISGYRDAFYPKPRTPSPPADAEPIDTALTPMQGGPSSNSSAEPLFSARPEADGDIEEHGAGFGGGGMDPDLEEMMALEEMEREAAAAEAASTTKTRDRLPNGITAGQGHGLEEDGPPVLDEEDEWEGLYD